MFVSMIDKKFRTKSSHILQPGKFDGKGVKSWLDNFELYLEEDNITEDKQKCAALLSRLSGEARGLVADSKNNYSGLRETLIHIYGGKQKSKTEYQSEFVNRNQREDENLYAYYATLAELCKKAHNDLNECQKQNTWKKIYRWNIER